MYDIYIILHIHITIIVKKSKNAQRFSVILLIHVYL